MGSSTTKSFGKRQKKRTRAVLSVRVQRQDGTSALAHTLDITYIGTRLGGLRMLLVVGEPVAVQRGRKRENFRVVWARRVGPGECQAGLEAVKRGNNMWDVELEDEVSADVLAK